MPVAPSDSGFFNTIGQKVDQYLTNYLRSTTTDQEILDFYGEGNVVGRKGIPANDEDLIKSVEAAHRNPSYRPDTGRKDFRVGSIDQEIGYNYSTKDIPGAVSPDTGRPWQMTFGVLPKDFGASSLTPAARQFLEDFRIPKNAGNDYSFATGPNIQDRINFETQQLIENDPYYGKQPEKLNQKLEEIRNQSNRIGDFSGQPVTPTTWRERGYIQQKPEGFKEKTLNEFRNRIFQEQGPFGGVSTLTPVEHRSAENPTWRANLYETEGLAGPLSEQGYSSGYGAGSRDVQRFTTGSERTLPLQPYTEFFQKISGATEPSSLGTVPAPDFTPLQKFIGTRNYLIGKNILEGRGHLGAGFNATADLTGSIPLFDPKFREAVEKGDVGAAARQVGTEYVAGTLAAPVVGAGMGVLQRVAPRAAAAAITGLNAVRIANPVAVVSQLGGDAPQPRAVGTYNGSTVYRNPQGAFVAAPLNGRPIRLGTAVRGGRQTFVPWGSVAGERRVGPKTVGRPWWDVLGSKFEDALNRFNSGKIIGR
jgi:hypothetical protein